MITTVTMGIDEFRQLEEKAKAFDRHVMSKDILVIKVPYGNDYYYSAELSEVFEKISKDVSRVEDYAESWRKKAENCK